MRYLANYTNDFGKTVKNAMLHVFLESGTEGIIETSSKFDSIYLPSVFLSASQIYTNSLSSCSAKMNIKPREAYFWLNSNTVMRVPLPFMPGIGGGKYNQFLIEAAFNTNIQTIETRGESINQAFVTLYARK